MGREGRIVSRPFAKPIRGVVASAGLGASVGFTLWATGLGVGSSLLEWLLAGAVFGLVAGGCGLAIGGLVWLTARALVRDPASLPLGVVVAAGAVGGAIPGVLLGLGSNRGIFEPIFYGLCGAIGASVATFVSGRWH